MELNIFVVHEDVLDHSLIVILIHASDQITNILIKFLSQARIFLLHHKFNVINYFQ